MSVGKVTGELVNPDFWRTFTLQTSMSCNDIMKCSPARQSPCKFLAKDVQRAKGRLNASGYCVMDAISWQVRMFLTALRSGVSCRSLFWFWLLLWLLRPKVPFFFFCAH